MKNSRNIETEKGATLLEVALTLPLFLGIIFGIIFTFMAFNARTSLSISIGEALRYGITRGDGLRVISDIDSYVENDSFANNRLPKYLYSRGTEDEEPINPTTLDNDDISHLNSQVAGILNNRSLSELPATYVYSLVYMHEYMRVRMGTGNVKYPCEDRAGCLNCRFLNPNSPITDGIDPTDNFSDEVPANRIYMECSYYADLGFFTTMMNLIGGGTSTPGLKFMRSGYINRGDTV